MKNGKYFIVLFCNKKRIKIFHRSMKRTTITEYWNELKTQKKPVFTKQYYADRKGEKVFELALVFPMNRWATKTFVKDSLGRTVEALIEDDKFRIKEIIPYWKEELVYDYQQKKRIRYEEVFNQAMKITDIAQIFTLNLKLFIQKDDELIVFGNKNLNDTERLFELLKTDLTNKKKGNYIYVKDISTHQRKQLYNLLESKGFSRKDLFKHYSY